MDPTRSCSLNTTSKSENEFGVSPHALGTMECTTVQSRVNSIAEGISDPCIGLSAYQMHNMRSQYGAFSVKNPETNSVMPVGIYNAWGPNCTSNKNEIIISKLVAETLNLSLGSPIEIERKMDPVGAAKLDCAENKDNHFGQDWDHRSYAASGKIVSACKDTVKGRYEIYLTDMQKKYLRLEKHLIPLCGMKKFLELKKTSPDALGVVRLKYQDKVLEADAYSNHECSDYPGASLKISESLMKFFGEVLIGADLLISSRFDKNLDKALLEDKSLPVPEMDESTLSHENYFLHIYSTPLEQLQKEFEWKKTPDFSWGPAAICLRGLTQQAKLIADHPEVFQKITHMFCHHVNDSAEYRNFLNALKENNEILHNHWDRYLDIIQEELLKADPEWSNPQIVEDFIKMGFANCQNSKGDTMVHIALGTGNGSFELEKKKRLIDFNIRNDEGQTPLHYATKNERGWRNLITHKEDLNPLVEDNNKRIPLHLACMNNNPIFSSLLFEQYPDKVEAFLSAKDIDGKTPFDYLSSRDILSILLLRTKPVELNNSGWKFAVSNLLERVGLTFDKLNEMKEMLTRLASTRNESEKMDVEESENEDPMDDVK